MLSDLIVDVNTLNSDVATTKSLSKKILEEQIVQQMDQPQFIIVKTVNLVAVQME